MGSSRPKKRKGIVRGGYKMLINIWEGLNLIVFGIGRLQWLISFIGLLFAVKYLKESTSILIALATLVTSNAIMSIGTLLLVRIEDIETLRVAWYSFFSVVNTITVISMHYLHKLKCVQFDKFSITISLSFVVLCFLQVSRYLDRFVFHTNILDSFYTAGINAVNISIGVLVITVLIKKKSKEVLA